MRKRTRRRSFRSTLIRTIQAIGVLILLVFQISWTSANAAAQSPAGVSYGSLIKSHVDVAPQVLGNPGLLPPPSRATTALISMDAGAGLVITPTFDSSIDAATQTVINNAIVFYESTITTPISVSIYFGTMDSGLGESTAFRYRVDYLTFRAMLASSAGSSDDTVALSTLPSGSTNPVDGGSFVLLKPANGRAIGLNTPGLPFNFSGSPCPSFTGDGCILINVTLANEINDLTSVIEHEMDEVLGLGSALSNTGVEQFPLPEDLFRWVSQGQRSYARNPSTSVPCDATTPRAFLSFNGGATDINEFNNCDNGGDYGDWISHSPSQVQDAFANSNAVVLTSTSSELRALDVIGYNVVQTVKKRRAQITSQ